MTTKEVSSCCGKGVGMDMTAGAPIMWFCKGCGKTCEPVKPKRKFTTLSKVRKEPVKASDPKVKSLLKRAFASTGKSAKAKAKKAADKWFSKFIRLRDSDEFGIVTCITSKRRVHWLDCDCGHWISRAKMATRYDERNCNGQSKQANRFQGGHFLEHGLAIDEKFGAGTREALELKARRPCKMTETDLWFIAETYRKRVENIEEQSPGKFQRAAA